MLYIFICFDFEYNIPQEHIILKSIQIKELIYITSVIKAQIRKEKQCLYY